MTLKIVCVNAGNYLGRGSEYVNILFDSVSRNISSSTSFEFICFTDTPEGLAQGITVRDLPYTGLKGWWNKISLFKPGVFNQADKIVFMDLDTVITGQIDEILEYPGKFAILRDFYRPKGWQSSVMIWTGDHSHIWKSFDIAGFPDIPGGDQAWIELVQPKADILQDLFPKRFVSYKVHCRAGLPDNASIIIFHGQPRPHDAGGWVDKVWKIDGQTAVEFDNQANTPQDQLISNIEYALALSRGRLAMQPANDDHAVIIGGGPSLKFDIEEIKMRQAHGQKIFALNNSWQYLNNCGIKTDFHVMLDARPENAKFVCPDAVQYYSSQCDRAVWDKAPDAIMWHHVNSMKIVTEAASFLSGGSTVGLNAMSLAYVLGYRKIHLYGFDSSYDDDRHHAYDQELNDGERTLNITVGDREFYTAAWMAEQVNQFKILAPQLVAMGCVLTVHGEGLLPYVANTLECKPPISAAELRANAIFEHIKDIKNPMGAEVGVFKGALSMRLLEREDLTLCMIDSWKEHGADSEYALGGDFHGNLSQAEQDECYECTAANTEFAGERAKIIRKDSIEAAKEFHDECLDFVFLDADHGYDAVKADIAAWLPKVKKGGILSGHDYENPDYPAWGVKQAVDEMCVEKGFKLVLGDNYTWFVKNEGLVNTGLDDLISNMTANCKKKLKWLTPAPANNKTLCIIGGSPSLKDNLAHLKKKKLLGAHVATTNGSLKFLTRSGLKPDYHCQFDARPENAAFVESAPHDVKYLIGSMSHPSVIDALDGRDVTLWHGGFDLDEQLKILQPYEDKPIIIVGGGYTIGLRAMSLFYHLGYRKFVLYGVDSSFREGQHHCYNQPLNDKDGMIPVGYNGKTYYCAPWMYRQAKNFEENHKELTAMGCKIEAIGDGLIPHMCKHLNSML